MRCWVDGDTRYAAVRAAARKLLDTAKFDHFDDFDELHFSEQRKVLMGWLKTISEALPFELKRGLSEDFGLYTYFMGQMATGGMNCNALVKITVQYVLFGGAIANLGTSRHHNMMPEIQKLQLLGSFGMTELGHGTNVRGIETTATYDRNTREFIIHTPNRKAMKTWIGGGGSCHVSAVFANLIVDGRNYGVHVFVVPMRDRNGNLLKGVYTEDCGYKLGLNGIDNFTFGFDHVRVPRENLLNRFGEVTTDGQYKSSIPNDNARFAHTVGELTGGRVSLSGQAIGHTRYALAIAIKYAFARRQFSRPGQKDEVQLISFPSHLRRLMPLLARTLAYGPFLSKNVELYNNKESNMALTHSTSSCFKASATYHLLDVMTICRQTCGGAGFRAANKISGLLRDSHIFVTFEGNNEMLFQQTAKYLVGLYQSGKMAGSVLDYATGDVAISVPNASDRAKLTCPKYLLQLFQQREFTLIKRLAENLAERKHSGENEFDAFNNEMVLAIELGKAHADRLLHQYMVDAVNSSTFSIREVLAKACQLNALDKVETNLGFFTSNEILTPSLGRKVSDLVVLLSKELAEYSLDVIESFGCSQKLMPPADLSGY